MVRVVASLCLLAAVGQAFVVRPQTRRLPSALSYTIIPGAEPDEKDDDDDAEPNFWAQRKGDQNAGPGSLQGYRDSEEMKMHSGIDDDLNVDAYDNMAGGIIPGVQLSAGGLCGDD